LKHVDLNKDYLEVSSLFIRSFISI